MGSAFGSRSSGLGSSPIQDLYCVQGQKYDCVEHNCDGCQARHYRQVV